MKKIFPLFSARFLTFCFLLSAVYGLLSTSPSFACWGFRPMGMGGVYVAIADDANAAYWNRAGLGMLDKWSDKQSEVVVTDRAFDSVGLINRTPRSGNQYYDSLNYVVKIDDNIGLGLAASLSGGNAFAISPSVGFRLPWFKDMAIGLGYYLYRIETYDTIGGAFVQADILLHRIDVDYLWRFHPEWSFGVHGENFWRLAGTETSPGNPTININIPGALWNDINLRPAIAWSPNGNLKGLIVNAGIYDLFAGSRSESAGSGPYLSFGAEYTPQPNIVNIQVRERTDYIEILEDKAIKISASKTGSKDIEVKKKRLRAYIADLNKKIIKAKNKKKIARLKADKKTALAHLEKLAGPKMQKYKIVKKKIKKPQHIYKEMVIKEENFWTRSSFRAGMYNYKMDVSGLLTLGYGYKMGEDFEIGYWGGFGIIGGSGSIHNLGIAYNFY